LVAVRVAEARLPGEFGAELLGRDGVASSRNLLRQSVSGLEGMDGGRVALLSVADPPDHEDAPVRQRGRGHT
jgi:hypothetical protein